MNNLKEKNSFIALRESVEKQKKALKKLNSALCNLQYAFRDFIQLKNIW